MDIWDSLERLPVEVISLVIDGKEGSFSIEITRGLHTENFVRRVYRNSVRRIEFVEKTVWVIQNASCSKLFGRSETGGVHGNVALVTNRTSHTAKTVSFRVKTFHKKPICFEAEAFGPGRNIYA